MSPHPRIPQHSRGPCKKRKPHLAAPKPRNKTNGRARSKGRTLHLSWIPRCYSTRPVPTWPKKLFRQTYTPPKHISSPRQCICRKAGFPFLIPTRSRTPANSSWQHSEHVPPARQIRDPFNVCRCAVALHLRHDKSFPPPMHFIASPRHFYQKRCCIRRRAASTLARGPQFSSSSPHTRCSGWRHAGLLHTCMTTGL